jgi:RNA polymerase sigma-70 factor (ECF subfamily)
MTDASETTHEVMMDDALQWLGSSGHRSAQAAACDKDDHVVEDPDAGLVAEARQDPARFLALYDRHFARVHSYVRVRIGEPASAEDVTSEVFLTALTRLGDFRGEGSFGAWLFRIAQNAVRAAYRQHPTAVLDGQAAALRDDAPGPEEQALSRERVAELRRLLAALRPEQQDLLALRYGAGLAYREIGELLGTSSGAARVAVHRILEDLRERYPHD